MDEEERERLVQSTASTYHTNAKARGSITEIKASRHQRLSSSRNFGGASVNDPVAKRIASGTHHRRLSSSRNFGGALINDPVAARTAYQRSFSRDRQFILAAVLLEVILIILFAIGANYEDARPTNKKDTARHNYYLYQQVNVMMFIGFGFLMTFLRRYGYNALVMNFMIAALCIQWGMYMQGLIDVVFTGQAHGLTVSVDGLAQGDIAAAAVLISFGALLGRVTPLQLLLMAFIEIVFYCINLYVLTEILFVTDVGGSMTVHTFGCYFGLAFSYVVGAPFEETQNLAEYHSDLFSMIGTIFLWMYWPSFNGIFAGDLPFAETRCFMNTVLALAACVIASMGFSMFFGKKFDMVHMQNSTLAGGVAMGSAANLYLTPAGAMSVGFAAAFVSVYGYNFAAPALQRRLKVWDTCGINNLHGMPGIFGALVSVIAIGVASTAHYGKDAFGGRSFGVQALIQFLGLLVTLAIAIPSGLVSGWLLVNLGCVRVTMPYQDKEYFIMPEVMHLFDGFGQEDEKEKEYEELYDA